MRKLLARPSDFGSPATHHIWHMFSRNGHHLREKHTYRVSGISPTTALVKVRALFAKEVVNY